MTLQNALSIDHSIKSGQASDGAPVKRADEVLPGDLVIVDWPHGIVHRVVRVMPEDAEGSGVHYCRWQVASVVDPADGAAFIGRLAHEYVRVIVPAISEEAGRLARLAEATPGVKPEPMAPRRATNDPGDFITKGGKQPPNPPPAPKGQAHPPEPPQDARTDARRGTQRALEEMMGRTYTPIAVPCEELDVVLNQLGQGVDLPGDVVVAIERLRDHFPSNWRRTYTLAAMPESERQREREWWAAVRYAEAVEPEPSTGSRTPVAVPCEECSFCLEPLSDHTAMERKSCDWGLSTSVFGWGYPANDHPVA